MRQSCMSPRYVAAQFSCRRLLSNDHPIHLPLFDHLGLEISVGLSGSTQVTAWRAHAPPGARVGPHDCMTRWKVTPPHKRSHPSRASTLRSGYLDDMAAGVITRRAQDCYRAPGAQAPEILENRETRRAITQPPLLVGSFRLCRNYLRSPHLLAFPAEHERKAEACEN